MRQLRHQKRLRPHPQPLEIRRQAGRPHPGSARGHPGVRDPRHRLRRRVGLPRRRRKARRPRGNHRHRPRKRRPRLPPHMHRPQHLPQLHRPRPRPQDRHQQRQRAGPAARGRRSRRGHRRGDSRDRRGHARPLQHPRRVRRAVDLGDARRQEGPPAAASGRHQEEPRGRRGVPIPERSERAAHRRPVAEQEPDPALRASAGTQRHHDVRSRVLRGRTHGVRDEGPGEEGDGVGEWCVGAVGPGTVLHRRVR
mmetsp:Transcript_13698/g.34938  ORF Transcript_13698/g.34938 Transcript_13698/m.34938 type:complete len:252 (-) Transcript_13698:703-1458(-)